MTNVVLQVLSPTAGLSQSVLVLAAGLGTALAEVASSCTPGSLQGSHLGVRADPCSEPPAGWTLPGGIQHTFVVEDPASWVYGYVLFGLVLVFSFFGLAYRFRAHPGASRAGLTRNPGRVILSAMALLTFASLLLLTGLRLSASSDHHDQPAPSWTPGETSQTALDSPIFTLPASADVGKDILANIHDPEAVDAQTVCPGYKAFNVHETAGGLTADLGLAGPACNVYGNDVEHLLLSVEFQADNRVHVEIRPRYMSPENETWFLLPDKLVPRPSNSPREQYSDDKLAVSWSNDPTFSFSVRRKETGDILFSTEGKVLVYEDQFIEFVSSLPENYNLYGLGEVIHGFRLGNNLTSESAIREDNTCGGRAEALKS